MTACSVEGCNDAVVARGLCLPHYHQARAGRIPLPSRLPRPTAVERLLAKIDQRGPEECWPWTAGVGSAGYGIFWIDGQCINASRATYILLVGPLGPDEEALHRCDNPICCNPGHLFPGTQGDNVRDCRQKGRATSQLEANGPAGHPRYNAKLTPEVVAEARRLHYEQGVSQSEIARQLGLSSSSISRAVRGESWEHVR